MGIKVIYMDMPCRIKGFVVSNNDNSFTIFINSKLNREQQIKVYKHEIKHIDSNDFDCDNIDMIENIRHR